MDEFAAAVCALFMIAGLILLGAVPGCLRVRELKDEAVKRGFAEWVVVNQYDGETEFRWREAK